MIFEILGRFSASTVLKVKTQELKVQMPELQVK